MKNVILVLLCCYTLAASAQPNHRRANYFETFVEVNQPIDSIVVFKSKRVMTVFHNQQKIKSYIISLGEEPIGKKQFEGDLKTPEGLYSINSRDTASMFHSNLGISYPNMADSLYAVSVGKSAGGDIKIHGFPNHHKAYQEREFLNKDWTIGCIAVSDHEIDELYQWVIENCPILILP